MKTTPSKFRPLNLVTREDEKIVIVAGNIQVSPLEFESEDQANDYLRKEPYEMMMNLMVVFDYYEKQANKVKSVSNEKKPKK